MKEINATFMVSRLASDSEAISQARTRDERSMRAHSTQGATFFVTNFVPKNTSEATKNISRYA